MEEENKSTTELETELAFLRFECGRYNLDGREILDRYTDAELSTIYNGAGPDSWIPAAREILTKAMSLFSPVVLIHDAQYTESTGRREDFEETVRCWTVNTRKIFDAEFPLWTLKMLKRSYRIERAYWWGVMKTSNAAIATETAFEAYCSAANRQTKEKNA